MSTTTLKLCHTVSSESFYQAVKILVTKPHVLNKRLWGSKIWFRQFCTSLDDELIKWPMQFQNLDTVSTQKVEEYVNKVIEIMKLKICDDDSTSKCYEIIVTELLPKNYADPASYQLIILPKFECKVMFYNITPSNQVQNTIPSFTYSVHIEKELILRTYCDVSDIKSFIWLKNTLLPQFMKWVTETETSKSNTQICTESLALVSNKKYFEKYNELKQKYGKEMVKIWPECTDPNKFVYEDVAIATYLLLLWEERSLKLKKQRFVDLGCGNGLLVYILCKEGHDGLGIDVRKRQIWDMYPPEVKLEIKTITPSESNLFIDADWIIGNHSDELTPWIPVIAARSSYKCNFFLLPCCAFNFDGTKYQRTNSKKSQYNEYLEHVKKICEECGFVTDIDRLKIPSTKRICLVSNGRVYSSESAIEYTRKIQELIGEKNELKKENNETWLKDFKPRESVEKVRNCTQLDKNLIESIVKIVTDCLLEDGCEDNKQWSIGKSVEINQLVTIIPKEKLIQLKSECGGLQTLLKNNHNIFLVSEGKVLLRYPQTIDQVKTIQLKRKKTIDTRLQVKPCWFYNNHPQGCPLSSSICSYLHSKGLND